MPIALQYSRESNRSSANLFFLPTELSHSRTIGETNMRIERGNLDG